MAGDPDRLDKSGCLKMEDADPPIAFCTIATRAAVERKAMLAAAHATATSALKQLDDPAIGDKFVRHHLKVILKETDDDNVPSSLGVISYDDLLLELVDALGEVIPDAEPRSLLELAQRSAHTLTGEGWLVVRPEFLRN